MKKIAWVFLIASGFCSSSIYAGELVDEAGKFGHCTRDSLMDRVLESWTYTENFENRELGAWASYPHWQDLAYDEKFRVNEILPDDPNISIVQKVTPYTQADNYAGAQKLLDMYLVPGAKLSFRFFLKTNLSAEFYKIRLAAGDYGKIEVTITNPETNKWVWVTVGFDDFVRENPILAGKDKVKIYALAFLAKIPKADPAMPVYLGLDDISFKSARSVEFQFAEPGVFKLPEFKPFIAKMPYHKGEVFRMSGKWLLGAKKVKVDITSYGDEGLSVYKAELTEKAGLWVLDPFTLSFPDGLYHGKITAYDGTRQLAISEFTIHIAPVNTGTQHPRLLFDADKKKWLDERFKENRFQAVYNDMSRNAKIQRDKIPVKGLIFDLNQFPSENWLPSWNAFGSRIYNSDEALKWNALSYAFHGDHEAGVYAKNLLTTLADWPTWVSPWLIRRGRFSEHRLGSWSNEVALAYDLTYELMNPDERTKVRKAIMKNIVEGAYQTYVYENEVISNTSNWIAHIVGGALMNMAAIFGDGPETQNLEPYFTGSLLKLYTFLNLVTDSKDGSWGEGLGYNDYTFSSLSHSLPSLKNVFNIDFSKPLVGTYNEFIWGGMLKKKQWFEFGDSEGDMAPATHWAFLLNMRREPRLAWYYNFLKKEETFEDVLYDTKNVKEEIPYKENPVKAFHKVGTTVFKSGWEEDGFTFVMRTGAFFNHQHLDQGSFWLADKGTVFIEERHLLNSDYYDDPLYQSHLIQAVAHSTILIDGNQQSQRAGDDLKFAPGFDDHAFIDEFLDGKDAAFSKGDIGKLYWGKIKSLSRNVLYLKPRTILMLDETTPGEKDVDVTLLYQTAHLEDIKADEKISTITKDGNTLNIMNLSPGLIKAKSVETPHYLKTLLNEKPLIKEGMLTLTARTAGNSLIVANLLTTTRAGTAPDVSYNTANGYVEGVASGKKFAFTTKPGNLYEVSNIKTDAICLTWGPERTFVAMASNFRTHDGFFVLSEVPMTFELSSEGIKYDRSIAGKILIGFSNKPKSVRLNGTFVKDFKYDSKRKEIEIEVPQGNGLLKIQ